MRKHHLPRALTRSLLSAFGLCLAFATSAAAADTPSTNLERFRSDYSKALLEGKPDPILSYAADGIRVMPEYHPTLFGKNNTRLYLTALFQAVDIRAYSRERLRLLDLGTRVVDIGRFTMRLQFENGGPVHALDGKYIEIWEQAAGKLTLLTHGWNYDRYPEIANTLRLPNVPGVRTAMEAHVPVNGGLSFELAALNQLQRVAIIQKDHKVWSQFYTDDALLLMNHGTAIEGKVAITEYLAKHTSEMPVFEHLDVRHDHIDPVGMHVIDYASHIAIWRRGDSSGGNTGKNVRIWRREADGSLKMITQMGMYD